MKLLWSSILLKVNNRLDLITTTLVGKVWNDICHNKRYFHICHFEEDIINKIDIQIKERSNQLRKKQMNYIYNNTSTSTSTSTSFIYPQTLCNDVNNYYITPVNSPQFSNKIITNQINYSNNHVSIPLSPISIF